MGLQPKNCSKKWSKKTFYPSRIFLGKDILGKNVNKLLTKPVLKYLTRYSNFWCKYLSVKTFFKVKNLYLFFAWRMGLRAPLQLAPLQLAHLQLAP